MNDKGALDEGLRQLRERLAELRRQPPATTPIDRVVDLVGDACAVVGLTLLLIYPFDLASVTLAVLGVLILGYNYLFRQPRLRSREQEKKRQIDMLEARLERMERELALRAGGNS